MIEVGRRGFIGGLIALVAAPAIVRPESLMVIKPTETIILRRNSLLTIDMITREAVKLFVDSNAFLQNLNNQYEGEFGIEGVKIGSVLRIRMPSDYTVTDGPSLIPTQTLPQISASEVAAIGAAAVLTKNPSISRRFWSA